MHREFGTVGIFEISIFRISIKHLVTVRLQNRVGEYDTWKAPPELNVGEYTAPMHSVASRFSDPREASEALVLRRYSMFVDIYGRVCNTECSVNYGVGSQKMRNQG